MASSMHMPQTALSALADARITSLPTSAPVGAICVRLPANGATTAAASVAAHVHPAAVFGGGGGGGDGQQYAHAAACPLHPRQRPHHMPPHLRSRWRDSVPIGCQRCHHGGRVRRRSRSSRRSAGRGRRRGRWPAVCPSCRPPAPPSPTPASRAASHPRRLAFNVCRFASHRSARDRQAVTWAMGSLVCAAHRCTTLLSSTQEC